MPNEDIIRMAREALKEDSGEDYYAYTHQIIHWWGEEDAIIKFAELVAAAEREACAVIAFNAKTYIEAANAIRARGQE
jgi:hypothetical protein